MKPVVLEIYEFEKREKKKLKGFCEELLNYQDSDAREKINDFSLASLSTRVNLLREMFVEEN